VSFFQHAGACDTAMAHIVKSAPLGTVAGFGVQAQRAGGGLV